MGAAMAPAACATIADFLRDTNTCPEDYDMILTGDLGAVGSTLLRELMVKQENIDISSVHADCGLILLMLQSRKTSVQAARDAVAAERCFAVKFCPKSKAESLKGAFCRYGCAYVERFVASE